MEKLSSGRTSPVADGSASHKKIGGQALVLTYLAWEQISILLVATTE